MTNLLVARVVAVILSLTTIVFLFVHGSWRADNIFLVPDLILCALLIAGALLPATPARPTLLFGFGLSAGVFATSVASYAVQGLLGIPSLLGVVAALVGTGLLLLRGPIAVAAARRTLPDGTVAG